MVETAHTADFIAQAAEGSVLLDGPGVACSLTPDAALHVADLLIDAAAEAVGQRIAASLVGCGRTQ